MLTYEDLQLVEESYSTSALQNFGNLCYVLYQVTKTNYTAFYYPKLLKRGKIYRLI